MKQVTRPCPMHRLPSESCPNCHGTGTITRWEDTLADRLGVLLSRTAFLAFVAVGFVVIAAVVVLYVAVLWSVI